MGNTLKKVVNLNDYKEYTYSSDNDILRNTQWLLNKSSEDKLLLKITQISAKCDYEGGYSTPPICEAIKNYKQEKRMSSYTILGEKEMEKYKWERMFVNSVISNNDFKKAYILEEEKNTIWFVIDNFQFKYKKVYLQSAREFKEENDCDFDIIIFDKKQLLNVEEQIKYMGPHEVISK